MSDQMQTGQTAPTQQPGMIPQQPAAPGQPEAPIHSEGFDDFDVRVGQVLDSPQPENTNEAEQKTKKSSDEEQPAEQKADEEKAPDAEKQGKEGDEKEGDKSVEVDPEATITINGKQHKIADLAAAAQVGKDATAESEATGKTSIIPTSKLAEARTAELSVYQADFTAYNEALKVRAEAKQAYDQSLATMKTWQGVQPTAMDEETRQRWTDDTNRWNILRDELQGKMNEANATISTLEPKLNGAMEQANLKLVSQFAPDINSMEKFDAVCRKAAEITGNPQHAQMMKQIPEPGILQLLVNGVAAMSNKAAAKKAAAGKPPPPAHLKVTNKPSSAPAGNVGSTNAVVDKFRSAKTYADFENAFIGAIQ